MSGRAGVRARLRRIWRADLLMLLALLAAVGLVGSASVGSGGPSAAVFLGEGFDAPESERGQLARWLLEPQGTLRLSVVSPAEPLRLEIELSSFARARRVAVTLDGTRVATIAVGGAPERQSVPLGRVSAGQHTIALRPTPGPVSIREVAGADDPRSVSLRLHGDATVGRGS